MSKAILLSDVEQVKDKYICFDEDYTCPLFNREKWKCQYRINTKTEDCPLRPLPEKKEIKGDYYKQREIATELKELIDFDKGYNACIDEILGEEEQ